MATSTGQYACSRILAWRTPLPDREAWQATVYRVARSQIQPKRPCAHRCKTFFACGSSAPVQVEREGGAATWLAGALAAPSVQGHNCLCCRSYGPIRVFFRASGSWQSEGLFGQSFSIAPPIQALRGLPCLGSFSVVWHIRLIERCPWLGSYSVVPCVRCLMGQTLYCSAAYACGWGKRLW